MRGSKKLPKGSTAGPMAGGARGGSAVGCSKLAVVLTVVAAVPPHIGELSDSNRLRLQLFTNGDGGGAAVKPTAAVAAITAAPGIKSVIVWELGPPRITLDLQLAETLLPTPPRRHPYMWSDPRFAP